MDGKPKGYVSRWDRGWKARAKLLLELVWDAMRLPWIVWQLWKERRALKEWNRKR